MSAAGCTWSRPARRSRRRRRAGRAGAGRGGGRARAGAELAAGVLRDPAGQDRMPAAERRRAAGDRGPALGARPLAAAGGQRLLRRAGRARRPRQGVAVGGPAGGRRSTTRPARRSPWRCRGRRASSSGTSGSSTAPATAAPAGRTSTSTTRSRSPTRSTPRRWRASSPSHVGAEIETAELRARFDAAFGPGAGERVQVHCTGDGGRTLVQEVTIATSRGHRARGAGRRALMLAADPVSPGCPRGVVDPAGLQ